MASRFVVLLVPGLLAAAAAGAQERKRLEMPAGMERPPAGAPALEGFAPPGIVKIVNGKNGPADPQIIASSGPAPAPTRMPTVDVYNNLSKSTWDQIRTGRMPHAPPGEIAGENRWTMPPSVGLVVQSPIGTSSNGAAPASIGFNAGPGVQPDGTTGGVSINARVRVPFGR